VTFVADNCDKPGINFVEFCSPNKVEICLQMVSNITTLILMASNKQKVYVTVADICHSFSLYYHSGATNVTVVASNVIVMSQRSREMSQLCHSRLPPRHSGRFVCHSVVTVAQHCHSFVTVVSQ
jgi:hypothetical protein